MVGLSDQLLKRTLSAWAQGYNGSKDVAQILAQQTGAPIPEFLPDWKNRLSLFKAAVFHQRKELIKHTLPPELRHLFLSLDSLALVDEELADVLGFHYLLRLDNGTLAVLLAVPEQQVSDQLHKGKQRLKESNIAQVHAKDPSQSSD